MRICFFIDNIAHTGGTERVTTIIANQLVKFGIEVTILSLWGDGISSFKLDPLVELHSIYKNKDKFKYKIPSTVISIRRFVKANHFDWLITVESILSFFTIPACSFINIKQIVWEHFNFNTNLGLRARSLARRLAARFADHIVVLTTRDKELWTSNLSCNAEIIAIPNPLPYAIQEVKQGRSKNVLAVGRLTYQKGFDLLINAWSKVKDSYPDWHLNIVGNGEDLPLLQKLIESLCLNDNIHLYPGTKRIDEFYSDSSIFCLSSRFEGLPMVLLESQAFGLPVVSFDCETGPSEVIKNGYNGILCKPEDIIELSEGLNKLIGDPLLRIEMSSNAFVNAQLFAAENITKQWIQLLQYEIKEE